MAFLALLEETEKCGSSVQRYLVVLERSMQTPCERTNQEGAIFLYDGECGFCDSIVMFLLDNSAANRLFFCPLHGLGKSAFRYPLTLLLAFLSFRYLEKPVLLLRKRFA
jgi:hypothetical protein